MAYMQVWSEATAKAGCELSAEERWNLGCDLIASSGDPVAAERVRAEANNHYRLVRVLEIVLHTGRPLTDFEAKPDTPLDYDFR